MQLQLGELPSLILLDISKLQQLINISDIYVVAEHFCLPYIQIMIDRMKLNMLLLPSNNREKLFGNV